MYRIDNIPRSIRILDGLGQVINNKVTDGIFLESIRDTTGQTFIRIAETKKSIKTNLFNTS
jgi:hypothetical protein